MKNRLLNSSSFSAVKPNDGEPVGQAGAEWNYQDRFFVRAGYPLNHDVARYALGGGLRMTMERYEFRVDYGYSDFDLLGAVHRFGIGITL